MAEYKLTRWASSRSETLAYCKLPGRTAPLSESPGEGDSKNVINSPFTRSPVVSSASLARVWLSSVLQRRGCSGVAPNSGVRDGDDDHVPKNDGNAPNVAKRERGEGSFASRVRMPNHPRAVFVSKSFIFCDVAESLDFWC